MQAAEIMLPPHMLEALQMVETALSGGIPHGQCLVVLQDGITRSITADKNEEEAA